MHFPLYLHFDWLLAYGQFVITLNSNVTPANNSFLHVDMMSFLQIMFCSPENKHGGGRTMILHEFKRKLIQQKINSFPTLVHIYHVFTFILFYYQNVVDIVKLYFLHFNCRFVV